MDLRVEWCGPRKQLEPVLGRTAVAACGAWALAKVDVGAHPQLAVALRVRSIPMVVAMINGELADGFLGALPGNEFREWLGKVLPVK